MCGRTFVDTAFPPTAASIGAWDNRSPDALGSSVKWKRVQDVIASGGKVGAKLFSGESIHTRALPDMVFRLQET